MEDRVIKAAGGSLSLAVEAIHAFVGLLVEKWSTREFLDEYPFVVQGFEILEAARGSGSPEISEDVCFAISSVWRDELERSNLSADKDLAVSRIWKRLLPSNVHEQDVRYYYMRSIRRRFGLHPSATTARHMHAIASAMSSLVEPHAEVPLAYHTLAETVKAAVAWDPQPPPEPFCTGPAKAYCDLCWALDRVKPAGRGMVTLEPEMADAEHLMSHLFGVPTGIPGFDELFGGGGLMLADSTARVVPAPISEPAAADAAPPAEATEAPAPAPAALLDPALRKIEEQGIGARVVLVIGPFGSGKSLLSLQMAVEVARKGGVAWVMALEQTDEECEYSMESIGVSMKHPAMQIYRGLSEAMLALAMPMSSKGALVFLRPEPGEKQNFSRFLSKVQEKLEWMSRYPLRLLVIDPVNALGQPSIERDPALRSETRAMFEAAKQHNVNVWFTSEQPPTYAAQDRFEENVADTVIHLGSEHGRRYIEITKSRFQHEYSGKHALLIEPQTGMHVYPPAAIIARSVRSSPPKRSSAATFHFGTTGMERLFGPHPPVPGDVIVLAGPGKGKTLLGVQFLTADLDDSRVRNVFISDYDIQRIGRFVETAMRRSGIGDPDHPNIVRCSIQAGFADPSRVLLQIRKTLDRCLEDGCSPGRVLVTNLSRWEKEMPSLGNDVSFGIALGRLLRSFGAVSVVISGDELDADSSPFRETLASQADALVHFHRREIKGRMTTLATTIKSRLMRHPRESFELVVGDDLLRVGPAPLFRANSAGDVKAVPVVLYLHAETPNHQRYNEKILAALRTTLSPNTNIARQSLRYDPQFLSMSQYSAVDQLQVFQLDEYQLPQASSTGTRVLQEFDCAAHRRVLEGRLPSLIKRVTCEGGKGFFAVPFYQNISFLAYRPDLYAKEFQTAPESWDDLVSYCQEWEKRHPLTETQLAASLAGWLAKDQDPRGRYPAAQPYGPGSKPDVFFSCPVYEESVETYNCFFMELLWALSPPMHDQRCDLATWLRPGANTLKAAMQFRALCRRSHLVGFRCDYRPRAIYWRHWYNTLNQELSVMPPEERSKVEVRKLFGDITTAGDWYLTIPAHSAASEIGLDLIENLTGSEREMQRLQLGVGLPTRESFYEPHGGLDPPVSPYFRFSRVELRGLVEKAIRRSWFPCYERFASAISAHLQSILELPDSETLTDDIERALTSLVSNIDFLRQSMHCGGCAAHLVPVPGVVSDARPSYTPAPDAVSD